MPTETKLPDGFRPMSADEGAQLDAYQHVLVYDRGLNHVGKFSVHRYSHHKGWLVARRNAGEIVDSVWLDEDNPDFWSDEDEAAAERGERVQRGPMSLDGNYTAVTLTNVDDLTPLLRESIYVVEAHDIIEELRTIRALEDRERAEREARVLEESKAWEMAVIADGEKVNGGLELVTGLTERNLPERDPEIIDIRRRSHRPGRMFG